MNLKSWILNDDWDQVAYDGEGRFELRFESSKRGLPLEPDGDCERLADGSKVMVITLDEGWAIDLCDEEGDLLGHHYVPFPEETLSVLADPDAMAAIEEARAEEDE